MNRLSKCCKQVTAFVSKLALALVRLTHLIKLLNEQSGELKYKYRNREFWCRGYYVDTVGKNETRIAEYIKNQLKEDELGEQMTIASIGPFTGGK
mgnify:CR=1 FL=1